MAAKNAKKAAANQQSGGFERTSVKKPANEMDFFKLDKMGVKRVSIIPYWTGEGNPNADEGTLHYERSYWIHRNIGANQDSYCCLNRTFKKPCPICDWMKKQKDPQDEMVKSLKPSYRQLFHVVDMKEPEKVMLWDISNFFFGEKLNDEINNQDDDESLDEFCELEGGLVLKLVIAENKFGGRTSYKVSSVNFKPRKEDFDADILDETVCLDDLLIEKTYDELEAIFHQNEDLNEDPDEDEDDADRAAAGDPDEDNEPDDDPDPEPEEDEEPEGEPEPEEDEEPEGEPEPEVGDDDVEIEKGDRVSAEIEGDDYEGVVKDVDGDDVTITFDDGDELSFAPEDLTLIKKAKKSSASKSSAKSSKDKSKKGKSKKGKCPHGGTFGKDLETLDECDKCDVWNECDEEANG